jgi:hypothetical protein
MNDLVPANNELEAQKIASKVLQVPCPKGGTKYVWKLSPPGVGLGWDGEVNTEYVMTSSVFAPYSGWETLCFPCTAEGEVTSLSELSGLRQADYHEGCIHELDYEPLHDGDIIDGTVVTSKPDKSLPPPEKFDRTKALIEWLTRPEGITEKIDYPKED